MADAQTFGLTPHDCRMAGYNADGDSTPSYDEIVELILDASEEIVALMDAKGVSHTAPSGDGVRAPGYRQGRTYVKNMVRCRWLRISGQEETRANDFEKDANRIYSRIEKNAVTAAGEDADTTDDAADLPYYSKVDPVYDGSYTDYDEGPVTLGRKLISQNEI